MKPNHAYPRLTRQRGAATLVVVMVLFFIVSLVAAYTNRNLIFEQRTSANQYRSTQALEAAEAGLEWAVTMLNFGRIDTTCTTSPNPLHGSFRERYIDTDPDTGKFTPKPLAAGRDFPTCVWNAANRWDCACPDAGLAALAPPAGDAVAPAFRIRLRAVLGEPPISPVPLRPGVIWVDVVGCTRLDAAGSGNPCLSFTGQGALNEGRVVVSSMLALGASASGMPLAALTVRGGVALTGGGVLNVYNIGTGASGLTVHASDAISTHGLTTRGAPGTPWLKTQVSPDAALAPASAPTGVAPPVITSFDRSFAGIFNMRPKTFEDQQAAVILPCIGGCNAFTVRAAIDQNPGRPLWLKGDLNVDSPGDIGSFAPPGAPVLMVVNGQITFTAAAAGAAINGLVYLRLPRPPAVIPVWTTSGPGRFNGAVVVDGDVVGSVGDTTVVYDSAILQRVRYGSGSFVRVPGSWRDFQ